MIIITLFLLGFFFLFKSKIRFTFEFFSRRFLSLDDLAPLLRLTADEHRSNVGQLASPLR